MSDKIKLSHAQIRAITKLGQGQASSTDYNQSTGKPQTWQALIKKGVVEKVPIEELAFNKRPLHEQKQWIRLTELGLEILAEIHAEKSKQKEPVTYVPEKSRLTRAE